VLVDDVVSGIILAAKHGRPGERYALGGENLTFDQFFDTLAEVTGRRRLLIPFPIWLMSAIARVMEWQAPLTGLPPLLTAAWVKKYLNHWSLSSGKAERELGYRITPFMEGAALTLDWLRERGEVR
jgi:nucleoside-diphosphate-sugar epimerase